MRLEIVKYLRSFFSRAKNLENKTEDGKSFENKTGIEIFNDFLKLNPIDGTVLVKIPAGGFLAGGDGDRSTDKLFTVT